MKQLKKISLHQLDKVELDKRQQGLLLGGGDVGDCKCGSCTHSHGESGAGAIDYDNAKANYLNGYTSTGSNNPSCFCIASPQSSEDSIYNTPSK